MEVDRFRIPLTTYLLTTKQLARALGHHDIDTAWRTLSKRTFPFITEGHKLQDCVSALDQNAIFAKAEQAMAKQIDLLGSGLVTLSTPIDWHSDPKVGHTWPPAFCRAIEYSNKGLPSDVKLPWEISRLQWMLPVGQAFVLTGNERYAEFCREVFEDWLEANPVAYSVNWSCTMEPALRILTWIWFFYVFRDSNAWSDTGFRKNFLKALYMHAIFVERHIERSRINGNHYTADAVGMVWAGIFFHETSKARRWLQEGWQILEDEIRLQIHPDGVDFEASCAYHRLVAELFWIAAHYRKSTGKDPSVEYANRLNSMADVTRHLCRVDGSTPSWGDADDGRALPLGLQEINDHRYLCDLIGLTLGTQSGVSAVQGGEQEVYWVFGSLPKIHPKPVASKEFPDGGLFVLRDHNTHVVIDCGPVGLAGLGGHGHNDALSFELWCDGHAVVVDPGSYVYTADFEARNRFRFTASHNTPQVGEYEINRPFSFDNLWNLHEDARAEKLLFEIDGCSHRFSGRHFGYTRLSSATIINRHFELNSENGTLLIEDSFSVSGEVSDLTVSIPFHFAPNVAVKMESPAGSVLCSTGERSYRFELQGPETGVCDIRPTEVSPRYGVKVPSKKLVYQVPLFDQLVLKTYISRVAR